ncbi:MAG: hypothetical protein H0T68_12145 [Gemmatimonadales bacterium]|nr:hypothetical protein [Gemmatimonadales bacterium]
MHPSYATRLPLLLLLASSAAACGPAARTRPVHPPAAAVLQEVGDHYAELGRIADSLTAETDASDRASGELAQVAALNLAGRIGRARGGFEAITLAMNAVQLERTRGLWVRLAVTEAALDLLYEDATRLASDPSATAGELHALSSQLAGSLELGRVSSRLAARQVAPERIAP